MEKISILMSLYYKERPEYLEACFDSLLSQTIKADEWVVVEDGPLTDELYSVLEKYEEKNLGLIKRIKLEKNMGLGAALAEGILHCENELIARMDTDDISRADRLEVQLAEFTKDTELDICGSYIDEFENNIENIVARREVPITQKEIEKYQKKRDAFNHVSVMFKKSAVLKAGNYIACPLMEDTYLWVRMIQSGVKSKNIPEPLVFVRVGNDMIDRRGGWSYFLKYRTGRRMVKDTGYIGYLDYMSTIIIQLIVALLPTLIRHFVYTVLLRKKQFSK